MTIDKLKDLALSESGFVFDPFTGATFSTNATGLVLLEGMRAGKSRNELAALLRERFELQGDEDLDRDIDELVGLLRRHRLVGNDFHV